jgi:hypothetical protein
MGGRPSSFFRLGCGCPHSRSLEDRLVDDIEEEELGGPLAVLLRVLRSVVPSDILGKDVRGIWAPP